MSKKHKKDLPTIASLAQEPNNLSDRLEFEELNNGIIRIDEAIDEFSTSEWMRKINYVVNKGLGKIKFHITSPGGSAYHALALYDKINSVNRDGIKTEAYVEGMAASAASMIVLQAIQKRFATANTRFLIHEPRRWIMFARERLSDMQDETKEMMRLSDVVYDIMSVRCKISKQDLVNMINRKETWLSATEAKKVGLIDAII